MIATDKYIDPILINDHFQNFKSYGIPKEYLIRIFTDPNDVVIDPVAGSGTTLLAAINLNRRAYGFEIKKNFCKQAKELIFKNIEKKLF